MPISTTTVEASLQAALDATTSATTTKELLLLTKATEALVPSVTLAAVLSEGATQVGLVTTEGTTQVAAVQNAVTNLSSTNVAETRSAPINMADNVIQRPEIQDYSETVQAMAANDVDCTLGNVQTKSISTAVTLTFSNPPVTGKAGAFTLIATFSGSPAITWPSSVKWAGGTAPTITAAGIDVFAFMTTDGGTTWFGFASGADMQ